MTYAELKELLQNIGVSDETVIIGIDEEAITWTEEGLLIK